jgi:uncharacterized RDD family membrane protein YckC
MASQPIPTSAWKQEVNRRVAAHKSRRGELNTEREIPSETRFGPNSPAALAAARVAARFSKAPSYNQMQTAEARNAVRAAKIATEVALEAQASARAVLAKLEAGRRDGPSHPDESTAGGERSNAGVCAAAPESKLEQRLELATGLPPQATRQSSHVPPVEFRLEPEGPAHRARPRAMSQRRLHEAQEFQAANSRQPSYPPGHALSHAEIDRLQAALPELSARANLIEFPGEQAGLKSAENSRPTAGTRSGLLSIFEVDPEIVQRDAGARGVNISPSASQWSGIELEEHPLNDPEPMEAATPEDAGIELAAFGRRAMAGVVDLALIAGAFLAAALLAGANMDQVPSMRLLEIGACAGMLVAGLLYQAFFFTLGVRTPGMKYARVSLCTFDNQFPTRMQSLGRLGAQMLSVLPLGLGLAWALFDEDHLCWHDRVSKTYQRECED